LTYRCRELRNFNRWRRHPIQTLVERCWRLSVDGWLYRAEVPVLKGGYFIWAHYYLPQAVRGEGLLAAGGVLVSGGWAARNRRCRRAAGRHHLSSGLLRRAAQLHVPRRPCNAKVGMRNCGCGRNIHQM